MTEAVTPTTEVVPAAARSEHLLRRVLRDPLGCAGAVVLLLLVLAAVFAPLIARQSPNTSSLDAIFAPISGEHWLGGDSAGRDLFARLVHGARISLAGAALATVVGMVIGVPAGLIAGYFGGPFDAVASWTTNLTMALPGIVVLLAARSFVGPSMWAAMTVFGVLLAPSFYRLVRAAVSAVRSELYVDAARVSGLTNRAIIGRHVLYVVRAPIIIQAAMVAAIAIAIQAGLEFLGLGDLTVPSWGSMLNEGFLNIFRAPQMLFWPGLAIALTSAALALLANSTRDALQGPRVKARVRRTRAANRARTEPRQPATPSGALPEGAVLSVRELSIAYPATGGWREVVHGVSFDVSASEVLGIVGESGSGKTQTALAVLGLLPREARITGGTITSENGAAPGKLLGRGIGYVPQEPMSNLDPSFTIGSQLTTPLRIVQKLSAGRARTRALEMLERVGITDPPRVYRSYPHQISGGMAQRVLIAGAVSQSPRLLVADEPTTALDVTVQAEILEVLRKLQQEEGMSMLLVTHNFGVVADICDRVLVMQEGRGVESDSASAIFHQPSSPYTRKLLDALLEGGPSRRELDLAVLRNDA
jgi:peptide/nickel transport system permease protein